MRIMIVLMLTLLSQPVFAAIVGTSVQVIAAAGGPDELSGASDFDQAFDASSASAAAISPHAGGSADGSANFGVIKVMAQANSQSGGYVGTGNATGSWTDIVTLSSGSFNGQQTRFTASVTLQGFI